MLLPPATAIDTGGIMMIRLPNCGLVVVMTGLADELAAGKTRRAIHAITYRVDIMLTWHHTFEIAKHA